MESLNCLVSGCTPYIVHSLRRMLHPVQSFSLSPNVLCALLDLHNHSSRNNSDLSIRVIGPMHPSGQPFAIGLEDGLLAPDTEDYEEDYEETPGPAPCNVFPETDIRVVPCYPDAPLGFVHVPQLEEMEKRRWSHFVGYGSSFVVQPHALDIMAVATKGRMTPLRLWRLAMKQGFYTPHPVGLSDVCYGEIDRNWNELPRLFSGFGKKEWDEVNLLTDVEVIKQRLVHEGKLWVWMAPDIFPVTPREHDPPAPTLSEVHSSKSHVNPLERLPLDVLVSIISILPLDSLVNLASTSQFLRSSIFGNEYLARVWISTSAPWWIPVQTRTDEATGYRVTFSIQPYLASQSTPHGQKVECNLSPVGLDWAYVRRCTRSGSMRNRRRIWNTVLDIERVADLAGV